VTALEAQLSVRPDNHHARLYLAAIEDDRGETRAEQLYSEAAEGFADTGKVTGEIYARISLSRYQRTRGRLREAGDALAPAVKLVESGIEPELIAQVRIAEAQQALASGDYGKALGPLLEAESILFPDGPVYLRGATLSALGHAYWALGSYRKGIDVYGREAEMKAQQGDRYGTAAPRYNIALLAGRLQAIGEIEQAEYVDLTEEALETAIEVGHRPLEVRCRLLLGQIVEEEEAAGSHFRRALELSRSLEDLQTIRRARWALSQLLWRTEPASRDEVLGWIDETIEQAAALGDIPAEARGLAIRAWMSWDAGEVDEAIADYAKLLQTIERIRDLQPEGSVRARVFSQWTFPYYRFSGGLLQALASSSDHDRDLSLAFETMERMRSRVLLDELDGAGARPPLDEENPFYIRRTEVLEAISSIQKKLSDPDLPREERSRSLEELERLESLETVLRDELARAEPGFCRLRAPVFPSLDEVRQALAPQQAVLSFQLSTGNSPLPRRPDEGGSWLIVITRDEVRSYRLPAKDLLESQLAIFLGVLQRRDGSESRAAQRLFRDLVGDCVQELDPAVDELIIIPDRALHQLPFGALRSGSGEAMASLYHISYAPSATVWMRWKDHDLTPAPPRGLAFADPEIASAPGSDEERGENPWLAGLSLNPLPYAREEASAMARSFGNDSMVLKADDASEHSLKAADLSSFGLLYFAAHAVVDNLKPERSAVLLTPGSPEEDGMLQIREIVELELDGRVVVLTACRSASGALLEGEGVVGLARAFFVAGARAVIGSLWPLQDDEAARLMQEFSRHLARGSSLGEALTAARTARMRAGDPPAAWAGIVLLGDGDYVPIPEGGQWLYRLSGLLPWLIGAAVLAALVTVALTVFRRTA
jgi:CHAT domain-containing protein